MTTTERITMKSKLDAHERRVDKVIDGNKENKKDRAKVIGIILSEMERELLAKCECAKKHFSRDAENLYELIQFRTIPSESTDGRSNFNSHFV